MPLFNSMGALKQQRIAGTVAPVTYNNFYSATDFNLAIDTNDFSVSVLNGKPYIYGQSNYSGTNYAFVCELNISTGALTKRAVYSDNGIIKGVQVDSSGNFHVLRVTSNTLISFIKYDSSWNYVTSKSFSGVTGFTGADTKISIDSSNNLYCGSAVNGNIAFVKIDSSYNIVWSTRITSAGGAYYPYIGIDSLGFMYCSTLGTSNVVYVQRINNTGGGIDWQKSFTNAAVGPGTGRQIQSSVVDSSGNMYVAMGTGDGSQRIFLTKFDTSGTVLYNKAITLTGTSGAVYPGTIVINSNGNVTIGIYVASSLFSFVELNSSLTIVNQSYISNTSLPTFIPKNGAAGTGKIYYPYIDTTNSNIKMMTVLSLPNDGYFGSTPATYNYTYNSQTFNNTLTANIATTYTIATNATSWNTTAFTLNNATLTTSTPTITNSAVVPFNYNQLI